MMVISQGINDEGENHYEWKKFTMIRWIILVIIRLIGSRDLAKNHEKIMIRLMMMISQMEHLIILVPHGNQSTNG